MHYRIISTGVVFPESELQSNFPNTSFSLPMDLETLLAFDLETIPDPEPTTEELGALLEQAKNRKRGQINVWRDSANQTFFVHNGKQIACDALSQRDIDKILGTILLTSSFPPGFPNVWKAKDNTYIPMAAVEDFGSMYASMVAQGVSNFMHSESLKATIAAATTPDQATIDSVNAITW